MSDSPEVVNHELGGGSLGIDPSLSANRAGHNGLLSNSRIGLLESPLDLVESSSINPERPIDTAELCELGRIKLASLF